MKKRIFSLFLAVLMVVSLFSTVAFAKDKAYSIETDTIEGVTVTCQESAEKDTTVPFTVNLPEGLDYSDITVTVFETENTKKTITHSGPTDSGECSFTMPNKAVTIKVTLKGEEPGEDPDGKGCELTITLVIEGLVEKDIPDGIYFTLTPENGNKDPITVTKNGAGDYVTNVKPDTYILTQFGANVDGFGLSVDAPDTFKITGEDKKTGKEITVTDTYTRYSTPIIYNGNVKYVVEHYLQKGFGYELEETEFFVGTIGDEVVAEAKEYDGYYLNPFAKGFTAVGVLKELESSEDIVVLKLFYNQIPVVNHGDNIPVLDGKTEKQGEVNPDTGAPALDAVFGTMLLAGIAFIALNKKRG